MLSTPIKVAITFMYALIIIGFYYFAFPHGQISEIKLPYLLVVFFLYLCYKAYYIGLEYDKIRFSIAGIVSVFLGFLFLYCIIFFVSSGLSPFLSVPFFFRILFFLAIPVLLHVVLYSFGEKIRAFIFQTDFFRIYRILLSFAIGYIVFFFSLSLLALFGQYSQGLILTIVGAMAVVSYKEILQLIKDIISTSFEFENHILSSKNPEEVYRPYLLSTEFLGIIIIGIIASNCISIFRPFPIGWDDLGVYMNFPKMLAAASGNIALGQTYPWQLYTGIGFLFHSQTLAFFLNSFSAVTAFFVTYLGIKAVLPQDKKTFFNIPLLAGTIFLSLPMVVFQVAKDMKLDIGLYTVSFLTVPLLILFFTYISRLKQKEKYALLLIIGLLAGLAFSIKLTSLLLISGIIGLLAYGFLGYFGFLSYLFFYISLFSFLGLWSMMNVVFPTSGIVTQSVGILSFILGAIFLGFQIVVSRFSFADIQKILLSFFIFLSGVAIMFLPWATKNMIEVPQGENIKMYHILGGYGKIFQPEYGRIYNSETLKEKELSLQGATVDDSGNVKNEDFGRYFGYEGGINNYLKLPWNLSMQVNQAGEYTDISYIFLALMPLCFLFLPLRKRCIEYIIIAMTFLSLLYFLPFSPGIFMSSMFGLITLPLGYIIILLPYIGAFSLLYYTLAKREYSYTTDVFLSVFAFTSFYVFLWNISAFGVVWYGVVMYGTFLLLFSLSYWYLTSYEDTEKNNEKSTKIFLSFLIFCIPAFYFFQSTIPYYLNNIVNAGFHEYKIGEYSENKGLFVSHPEYITVLYALNIDDSKKTEFMISYKTKLLFLLEKYSLQQEVRDAVGNIVSANDYNNFLSQLLAINTSDITVVNLQKEITQLQEVFYEDLINTPESFLSQSNIYRVGTFMKYFITRNNERLLEDSLLIQFDTYFHDAEPEVAFSRMKELGIDYLLVDLNAATIDDDPRRGLTNRYEKLLSSLISEKLTLIDTDSICLKLALAEKNPETFLTYAGVNYESYLPDRIVSRGEKFGQCQGRIIELLRDPETDIQGKYSFLYQIQAFLAQNNLNLDDEGVLRNVIARFGVGYKVLMKIEK